MKICNICHRISATGEDHIDCVQKRNIELNDENMKNSIQEKLNLSKMDKELGVEVRALLEHLSREKESN
ncbi:MAG: hypothetical protein ACW9WZ_03185 [Nitrosopumilus sp.]|jgi:hypothetical protein